jgi:hypothetical protein
MRSSVFISTHPDTGTRYESSLLLWARFLETAANIRAWLDTATGATAEIQASTEGLPDLLARTRVRSHKECF